MAKSQDAKKTVKKEPLKSAKEKNEIEKDALTDSVVEKNVCGRRISDAFAGHFVLRDAAIVEVIPPFRADVSSKRGVVASANRAVMANASVQVESVVLLQRARKEPAQI